MHASLDPSKISRLPFSLRRMAASARNGSMDDLRKLLQIIDQKTNPTPMSTLLLFLPVLYAHIDLAKMPSSAEMDTATFPEEFRDAIFVAKKCIPAICDSQLLPKIQDAALVDLWPRLWGWSQFFLTYQEILPQRLAPNRAATGVYLLQVANEAKLQSHTKLRTLVTSTRGLRRVVVSTWVELHGETDPESQKLGFYHLRAFFLSYMRADDPKNLEEIVDGAGGSLSHLAFLTVQHLRLLALGVQTDNDPGDFAKILNDFMRFLTEIDTAGSRLSAHLLSHGLIQALTSAIAILAEIVVDGTVLILHNLFVVLAAKMGGLPVEEIVNALDAGLLRAIIKYVVRAPRGSTTRLVKPFLAVHLPGFTVYYSVASRLGLYIEEARVLAGTVAFVNSDLYETWTAFLNVVERRMALVEYFDSEEYSSHVACDNLECGRISIKSEFQRCSACQKHYYCSSTCQRSDWQQGGHREGCKALHRYFLYHPDPASKRTLSFMRAVLEQDYKLMKTQVLYEKMVFLGRNRNSHFAVFFSYTGLRPGIEVLGLPDPSSEGSSEAPAPWFENLKRASRSGGRLEIHIVLTRLGTQAVQRIFPMRSNTSRLHDAVIQLAKDGDLFGMDRKQDDDDTLQDIQDKKPDEEVLNKLETLIKETDPEVVEVHRRCS
ncbi:hypothetical protein C8R43DRAFT_1243451 [Mycena crocata]|nr:hypothetical protein C8R43DRAFT_1243451 [Mycena crocata]